MDQNSAIILSACITALVTITGFIVTYFLNKRNFQEEVKRQKVNVNLEKIADLPYTILELMDTLLEKGADKSTLTSFKGLMASIFAYGSKNAISIAASMQEAIYKLATKYEGVERNEVLVYYILLACQVKYDLTGIEINPQYWYRMRITDYLEKKSDFDSATNRIVERLELLPFFKV